MHGLLANPHWRPGRGALVCIGEFYFACVSNSPSSLGVFAMFRIRETLSDEAYIDETRKKSMFLTDQTLFQPSSLAKFCDECVGPYLRQTSKFCFECGIRGCKYNENFGVQITILLMFLLCLYLIRYNFVL